MLFTRRGTGRFATRAGALSLVATLVMAMTTVTPAAAAPDSAGSDFWLGFPGNYTGSPELTLFITGGTATTGTVAIPGLAFSTPFSVTPGTVTSVPLPPTADIQTSDVVESKGIHVTAQAEVTVYGLSRIVFTTDAYLGLPTDILGTEYIVLGYKNVNIVNGTEFAVVATQNATTVTITPSVTTGARTAGVPYNIVLNQGQTYQLRNTGSAPADLSGTIVTANKPVAVFGGAQCANIPDNSVVACDHVVEEMFPVATWGRSFVTMPLATRTRGDTFRFLAGTDGTTVQVNGVTVATLNRGQLFQQIVTGPGRITANNPILVAQYSNSTSYDGVTSDPFEMLIPPFEQFLSAYTVTTPATGFAINFINVVAPSSAVGAVTLDGAAIPAGSFTAIGSSGFSGAQLPVSVGVHNLAGPQPFGAFVYGFAQADSYGYPGGLSLAPVARVTSVTLTPKTATNPVGTQHCVTAAVKDQNGAGLAGVRVDFAVTGANTASGSVNTTSTGNAQFCYVGTHAGTDTITATVGTISDTATKTWGGGVTVAICSDPSVSPTNPPAGYNVVVGTAGNDTLTGTSGKDVIFGLGGQDQIDGKGGDDIVFGGDGNDRLVGGDENDILCGGDGHDYLDGGPGNDGLDGGPGNDRLLGGPGDDVLMGAPGYDNLDGGTGTNTNDGGTEADSCTNGTNTNCNP